MKPVNHMNEAELFNYYQEAKSWYEEKYESVVCSRNRYRVLAFSLMGLLGLAISSICIMMPLKKYIYRILEVNKQTGEVTVLKEMEGNKFTSNWALTHYFLNQYVAMRESYSFEDIKRKFNTVAAMSDQTVADAYIASIVDSNPKSPINTYKNTYYKEVNVVGIDKLNDHTALVRFKVITHNKNDFNDTKTKDWHAVVNWKYINVPDSLQDRDKNPLGFKVTYYQLEPVFSDN